MILFLQSRVQPSLQRRDTANACRSTHLICSEASGAKYNGAVNWGLPVVTSQWLLNCVMANERLSEKPYLLGKSAGKYIINLFRKSRIYFGYHKQKLLQNYTRSLMIVKMKNPIL